MRFEELLDRHERGELTQAEAAEMLGMWERTFRRWRERYREEGAAGLARPADRQAVAAAGGGEEIARMLGLYAELYGGFTVKHFHEQLVKRHDYQLGYTVTRLALQAAGLVKPAPRRGGASQEAAAPAAAGDDAAPGRRAPRLAGGPAGARPGGHARRCDERDLLGLPGRGGGHRVELSGAGRGDRATTACSARSTPTAAATTSTRPRPASRVDDEQPTQVGRALAQLGIEHIAAYSPQARGRSERAFRTLQDRLPKELALAGITDDRGRQPPGIARASTCRSTTPASRSRAEQAGSAFVADRAGAVARHPLPPGEPPGRQRQHRELARPRPADPAEPAAAALRPRHRARCTNIPTARSRSSGARTVSPTSRRTRRTQTWLRDPLRRRLRSGQRCRVAHTTTTTEAVN